MASSKPENAQSMAAQSNGYLPPVFTNDSLPGSDPVLLGLEQKLQRRRFEMVEQFNSELQDLMRDVHQECLKSTGHPDAGGDDRRLKDGRKVFVARESILTELLRSTHIQTIYNIFVAVLIIFALNTLIMDYMEHGRIVLNFSMLFWCFGHMPIVISAWMAMFVATILMCPALFAWASIRDSYVGKHRRRVWLVDYFFLLLYIVYIGGFFLGPLMVLSAYSMPPGSSLIILCEQIRLLMKAHAFVRESCPRVLSYHGEKAEKNSLDTVLPGFSSYLYFLFCPTLVYREHYPRSEGVRWTYVISNLLQVAGCLMYTYYIFVRFCVPVFKETGLAPWNSREFVLSVMNSMLPSTMVFLLGFFSILHSWLNAFAEMMSFADRMFYRDWWNCRSWAAYYRKWNVVVHDWLHTYVYADTQRLCKGNGRQFAMFTVFFISAVIHEYILAAAFGFIFPVLLIMFGGVGVSFIFLTHQRQSRVWNIFMWVMLFFGNGLLMCLYSLEWYSRLNCPNSVETPWLLDLLIPRLLTCTPPVVTA